MAAELLALSAQDLTSRSEAAVARVRSVVASSFGPDGLGILLVNQLPPWYPAARSSLLAAARGFASLPPTVRQTYEIPAVDYTVGWSHGREQFRGKVDMHKGSFYANPVYEDPSDGDANLITEYPHSMTPNIWPHPDHAPACADLAPCFRQIGQYINDLGIHLAWHCDALITSSVAAAQPHASPEHPPHAPFTRLYESLRTSRAQKGRLLHYFPVSPPAPPVPPATEPALWCGYHNDHGTLTGLVCGEWYSEHDRVVLPRPPDPAAGLYVYPHGASAPHRVPFPADAIAFQVGETAQIMSGGVLRAAPHAVRAGAHAGSGAEVDPRVCRSTLAVFLQPGPEEKLDLPPWDLDGARALENAAMVPAIGRRYAAGDSYAQFAAKCIQAYVNEAEL